MLMVFWHPEMTAQFASRKAGNATSLGSGIEELPPRFWGLFWWGLLTFSCGTKAMLGSSRTRPIRKIWSWLKRAMLQSRAAL